MRTIISLMFLALAVLQAAATMAGLEAWQGVPVTLSFPPALLLACTPILGTVAAIVSAVAAWQWSWLTALSVFTLPVFGIAAMSFVMQMRLDRAKNASNPGALA